MKFVSYALFRVPSHLPSICARFHCYLLVVFFDFAFHSTYSYIPNTMSDLHRHDSSQAPEPVGLYPHALKVGPFLYLSGVGPRQRGSRVIPGSIQDKNDHVLTYDIEAQCHSVFQNVRWILEEAGASWESMVDVTVFLTNMKDDFETYNRIYADYFRDHQPCRTTVGIDSLPTPIAIELKVIAYLGE